MDLEVTIHRFGGEDGAPRQWGPRTIPVALSAIQRSEVISTSANNWLHIQFSDWFQVNDEWLSLRLDLTDMNGWLIGSRPAMLFDRPYDIPTHTHFQARHPDAGAFVVALRKVSR